MWLWLHHTEAAAHLAGVVSAEDYMSNYLDPSVRTLSEARRSVDSRVGPDERILMLYESRALYFKQPVLQDTRASNWPLLASVLERGDCLEASGITHVLLSTGAMRYYMRRGADPEVLQWDRFLTFAADCLGDPVYEGAAFLLFERRRD